ncbi:MAG: prenyltransferase [Muribaculaceae bacterium]|nr:prenyltransferase [Muribaculaceae bacterium]
MNSLTKTILYNAHPASLIISTGAVMGGLTASVIRGGITLFPAIMTLIFALLLQTSANLYHGYLDLSFGAGENISGMNDRDSRSLNSSRVMLLKIVANGFGILTLTAGLSLFPFIRWIGVGYFVLILVLLYFYFAGPKPAVRTKWSLVFTFLLFGPIAVSGTALIQNIQSTNWLPVAVYSCIIGLLAVNAHIAVQYLRYEEDLMNGKETLVTAKGGFFTRFVYLGSSALVTAILVIRPSAVDFVSPWVGIIIGIFLLASSIWVFSMMHRNPTTVSRRVRTVTIYQYIIVTVTLLVIVLCSMDDFKLNFIQLI